MELMQYYFQNLKLYTQKSVHCMQNMYSLSICGVQIHHGAYHTERGHNGVKAHPRELGFFWEFT